MPFTLAGWTTGSSPSGPRETSEWFPDPLMGFGSSSEAAQAPSRRPEPLVPQKPDARFKTERQLAAPPLRFRPLQRLPSSGQRHELAGDATPTACAFRFSQPPGAFIRPEPAGLVPCRIRSWGHPPEPSSSRAAVRCFQRRSPLGVRTAFRVLLNARVHHPVQLFRLKTGRVALLGLFPFRVLSLSTLVRPSSDLPSCGCPFGLTAERAPLQGLSRREHGSSLSRPPTLLGFVAFWSSCSFEPR